MKNLFYLSLLFVLKSASLAEVRYEIKDDKNEVKTFVASKKEQIFKVSDTVNCSVTIISDSDNSVASIASVKCSHKALLQETRFVCLGPKVIDDLSEDTKKLVNHDFPIGFTEPSEKNKKIIKSSVVTFKCHD